MKRIINTLDKHRILLILLILLVFVFLFVGIRSYIFFHHSFKKLECTSEIDDIYCMNGDNKIYKDPKAYQEQFFKEKESELRELKNSYQLPEFTIYTAYYYETASLIDYKFNSKNKDLYSFLKTYDDTYQLENFYKKNSFFYDIYYPYHLK